MIINKYYYLNFTGHIKNSHNEMLFYKPVLLDVKHELKHAYILLPCISSFPMLSMYNGCPNLSFPHCPVV